MNNVIKLTVDSFYDPQYKDVKFTLVGGSTTVLDELEKRNERTIVRRLKIQKASQELIDRIVKVFPELEELDLSVNHFDEIPKSVFKLSSLKHLMLKATHLKQVPPSISKLENLEYLDISFNQITNIPKGIFNSNKKLKVLDISSNRISVIGYNKFPNLVILNAALNYITDLVIEAKELMELNLNHCIMEKLESMSKFTKLVSLNLSSQRMSDCTIDINSLPCLQNLQYLNIAGNRISITDEIFSNLVKNLPEVKNVDIAFNDILFSSNIMLENINIINDTDKYVGII